MKNTKSIENNAEKINRYLISKIKGEPKILYDAAGHLIVNGGKRLRPFMVVKSCEMLGGRIQSAIPAASAVEMIHNFTLVHDDIMDNDEMRHGVPTVHKKFGVPVAILAGDVLFSKAYQLISESKLSEQSNIQLISRLAKACVDVCEGQILDIKMSEQEKNPTEKEYITMIAKKTAALFDVSCSMGAICATSRSEDITRLSIFGKNLGIAFQITDDLIGIMGDPKITKKPVGNDIREGKKSLPILMAIKSAKGNDKKIIMRVFGNSNASKEEIKSAIEVIKKLGIEDSVRKQALKYAEKAEKAISKYSGSAKTELISLLDFVVKRSL